MSAHVTQFDSQKLVGAPSRCTKKFLPGAMTSSSCRANYVESSQFCCASASGENNAPSFATQQKLVLDTVDATVGHVTGVHKACVIVSGSMVSKPFTNALWCRLQLKEEGYMVGERKRLLRWTPMALFNFVDLERCAKESTMSKLVQTGCPAHCALAVRLKQCGWRAGRDGQGKDVCKEGACSWWRI